MLLQQFRRQLEDIGLDEHDIRLSRFCQICLEAIDPADIRQVHGHHPAGSRHLGARLPCLLFLLLQEIRQEQALAARSGAKVGDGFSGFGIKQTRRQYRGWILQVKRAFHQQAFDLRPPAGGHDKEPGPRRRLKKPGALDCRGLVRHGAGAGRARPWCAGQAAPAGIDRRRHLIPLQ